MPINCLISFLFVFILLSVFCVLYSLVCSAKSSCKESFQKALEIIQGSEYVFIIWELAKCFAHKCSVYFWTICWPPTIFVFSIVYPFLHLFSNFRETEFYLLLIITSSSSSSSISSSTSRIRSSTYPSILLW